MVSKIIQFAVHNALIVILMALGLVIAGIYSFLNVNVEAYPDPAPAIIEVLAQNPGASAEEMERLVTIPLEVALAGMPGLTYTRSKSLAGLSHLRNQFEYGVDYYTARQEVINRLAFVTGLPAGVAPSLSPFTPTGELLRYTIISPTDESGREIYTLRDLKALQDWTITRELIRLPKIAGLTSFGGEVKRYEIHPDPEQMKRYGISLGQFQNAISNANANVGAGYLNQGGVAMNVRGIGLLGRGDDPMIRAMMQPTPRAADHLLREAERDRLDDIRDIVVTAVNNVPVRVRDLVVKDGLRDGVKMGAQPRLGRVSVSRPILARSGKPILDKEGNRLWNDQADTIQGILLMRKNEATEVALAKGKEKIEELNKTAGRMLPGTEMSLHFDLTGLLHVTKETVRENLFLGMVLVTVILLMFLSNVRTALIVAINIPLALLFAFAVLFFRGKSANLLSIGAVDFGIIVDSSVIMVENIYRHISSGENASWPLKDRIIHACHEVEKPLFYSTAIMVCAFIPLFTMRGPEGQIFGPMADTYAFALGGALLLALTVAPALCVLLFRHLKPAPDNFLVRYLKRSYLHQLERCLNHRVLTLTIFLTLICVTLAGLPFLGREFMPELEEGNLYIRATFAPNISLDEASEKARAARALIRSYPEVAVVESQVGRPDDGTDPCGFYNVEFSVPLIPEDEWPKVVRDAGWRRPGSSARPIPAPNRSWSKALNYRSRSSAAGHRLELFAVHPRQRHGVAVRRQGRQLGQDHRPGPRHAGKAGRAGQGHPRRRARRRERGHLPHQGPAEPGVHRRSPEVQALERQRPRRGERHRDGGGRPGIHADDRRREDLRHRAALAGAPARQRAGHPRHSGGRDRQHDAIDGAVAGALDQREQRPWRSDAEHHEDAVADDRREHGGGHL